MYFYEYFRSYKSYFWQWEDAAEVLAIPNSSTIVYRDLVQEILDIIEPQGIPPFGALLLAIVATNPNGKESLDTVLAIAKNTSYASNNKTLTEAISFLKMLSEIDKEYKRGKKRILLFQALFEDCHYITSITKSRSVVRYYKGKHYNVKKLENKGDLFESDFKKDFRTIALLEKKFPTLDLIIEKIASLPEIEEDIIISETEKKDSEDIITELIENSKTFHVGVLVKRIWSGLNIPLHSILPSQQPLGGVSDLTNKGDFDRLLLSEYANEDVLFLSRLANNEALYFHRETPPSDNNLHRIILIDISLKNWGTPKTIAFATMLAIAKHPKTDIVCTVFAIGDRCHPIEIDSIDSIIAGVQILEGCLNASKGLEMFFNEHGGYKNAEVFLITEASALKQKPMLKMVSTYNEYINYWVHPDIDGNIDVYRKQRKSKKHIQHLKVPIGELWKKKSEKIKTPTLEIPFENYPILFRPGTKIKEVLSTQDGEIFQVTGDRLLLRLYNKSKKHYEKGWEILYEDLPLISGKFEIGVLENGHYILLSFNIQSREITLINLNTKDIKKVNFNQWKSTVWNSFIFRNNKFHHTNMKGTWSIDSDGNIEKSEVGLRQLYKEREAELKVLNQRFGIISNSILKNVKEVFINEENNLIFNVHELCLNVGHHIKLDHPKSLLKKIRATKENNTDFIFKDGSRIMTKRSGMFVLQSSNKAIPKIYIPSMLNSGLGVAANNVFAGNEYYLKTSLYKVKLSNPGPNKLAVVKTIKELNAIGLKQAKEIVDGSVGELLGLHSKDAAENIVTQLESIDAEAHLIRRSRTTSKQFEKISTTNFFSKYINAFIQNIIAHGIED